jgi:hypothetical protein
MLASFEVGGVDHFPLGIEDDALRVSQRALPADFNVREIQSAAFFDPADRSRSRAAQRCACFFDGRGLRLRALGLIA